MKTIIKDFLDCDKMSAMLLDEEAGIQDIERFSPVVLFMQQNGIDCDMYGSDILSISYETLSLLTELLDDVKMGMMEGINSCTVFKGNVDGLKNIAKPTKRDLF